MRRKLIDIGYRVFFGDTEVTPGSEKIRTSEHLEILRSYLFAKKYEALLPEGAVFIYKGGISATVPVTDGFPEIIREAFQPLVLAQRRIGDTDTVMGPLIAIRKEILQG